MIRGNGNLNDGIIKTGQHSILGTKLGLFWQFNDTVMLLRHAHFTLGNQHTIAFNTADF